MPFSQRVLLKFAFISTVSLLERTSAFVSSGGAISLAVDVVHHRRRTSFQLPALVYYDSKTYVDAEDYNSSTGESYDDTTAEGSALTHIKEMLESEKVAALARIATAFCPEDQGLDLKEIVHVEVVSLDENHVDIQATVRAGVSLVAVRVPVDFPKNCSDYAGMEDCFLENIDELDKQALSKLRNTGISAAYADDMPHEWKDIAAEKPMYLPPWWKQPAFLDEDCEYLMELLNDEAFEPEIVALAAEQLNPGRMQESLVVEKASVIAIGPLGVHLRAQAKKSTLFEEDETIIVGEVTHTFTPAVYDSASMQSALLDAFVLAHDNAEDEINPFEEQ